MLLKSEISGQAVQYGTGEKIGRVRDLIVNTQKANWPVTRLVLSRGLGRGTHLLDVPTRELEIDREKHAVVRHGHAQFHEETSRASSLDHLRLSLLDGARVYSHDDQPIGRAYDFVIATTPPEGWLVWRFLVRVPGGRSRRLRLHVADIESVQKGKITLKAEKDEIRASS